MRKFFLEKKGFVVGRFFCSAGGGWIFSHFLYFEKASLSDDRIVMQAVTGECNRNSICEKELGKNIITCEIDCRPSSFLQGGDPAPIDKTPTIWGLEFFDIKENSARVKWGADNESVCEMRWSENTDYEKGSLTEVQGALLHSINLKNLSELTTYHFKIFCRGDEMEIETYDHAFMTRAGMDLIAPNNVTNLSAWYMEEDGSVVLRWKNPKEDFAGVSVLRNDRYFPRDQYDGIPLCDGNISMCDDSPAGIGETYYYTVFAYDKSNNYSSGTVISFTLGQTPVSVVPDQTATSTVTISGLSLSDIIFSQDGQPLVYENGHLVAKTGEKIVVLVDKDQTYLFKADTQKLAYVSDFHLDQPDIYLFTISVTDLRGMLYNSRASFFLMMVMKI